MNYNTQLCKTALGKKFLVRVTKSTCFCSKNRDRIFFERGAGAATEKQNVLFKIVGFIKSSPIDDHDPISKYHNYKFSNTLY